MTPARYDLGDYKEVSERIIDFRQKYPDGSLASEVILWPTQELPFLAVKASAYRSKQDQHPGVGLAWEPFPGRTPYTKDSELQNAETSAWGRAIVAALASDTKQGIASADEVRARRSDSGVGRVPPSNQAGSEPGQGVASPAPPRERGEGGDGPSVRAATADKGAHLPAAGVGAGSSKPESPSPPQSDSGEANTSKTQAPTSTPELDVAVGTNLNGEGGEGPAAATPDMRERLLRAYGGRPSAVKLKAVDLFGYKKVGDVLIADLSAAEVEALILEAAS